MFHLQHGSYPKKTRRREIVRHPKYNGNPCPSLTEETTCNTQRCPIQRHLHSYDWVRFKNRCTDENMKISNKSTLQVIAKYRTKGDVIKSGDVVGIHWGLGKWFSCPCGCCDLNTCPGIFFIISYVGIL